MCHCAFSQEGARFLRFRFTSHGDWFKKKLASSSRQIRFKTETKLDLVIRSFLTSFSAVYKLFLELSLAPCDVISFLIGWCIYSSSYFRR